MKKSFNTSNRSGFSLMEMMVVLLIVAIVAAATAPMVTKKMSKGAGISDSPWLFTGNNDSITFNPSGDDKNYAIIGASEYDKGDKGPENPRLVLAGGRGLVFADDNGKCNSILSLAGTTVIMGNSNVGAKSVAIGFGQTIGDKKENVTALGYGVKALDESVAIGSGSQAGIINNDMNGQEVAEEGNGTTSYGKATAVGYGAKALNENAVAVGYGTVASGGVGSVAIGTGPDTAPQGSVTIGHGAETGFGYSIAIGKKAKARANSSTGAVVDSIAIGNEAQATAADSIAIGNGVTATQASEIVLGTSSHTVYIPGKLVVGGQAILGADNNDTGNYTLIRPAQKKTKAYTNEMWGLSYKGDGKVGRFVWNDNDSWPYSSDRRLKNVGERFTAGLAELNKLDVYNYTYKKDKENTPRVGVMAQDLQKVFPNAVVKGDDGFLRIRMEDMFYAMINAIKQLNTKVCEIVKNVTDINAKIDAQQKTIEEQQKTIKELQAQNAEFEKRLTKLENNKCKCKK